MNCHANLKYKYGNRNYLAISCYVNTVGLNTTTIQKYIENKNKTKWNIRQTQK